VCMAESARPKVLHVRRWILEFLFIFAVERSVNHFSPSFLPHVWFVVLVLATLELLLLKPVQSIARGAYSRYEGKRRVLAFVVLFVLGGGLICVYWWGISRFFIVESPRVRVFIGERLRLETREIEIENIEDFQRMFAQAKLTAPVANWAKKIGENPTIVNIIVRNTSKERITNPRISITSSASISLPPEVRGGNVFDAHNINFEPRWLSPYDKLSEESYCTIAVQTDGAPNPIYFIVTVYGDNLDRYIGTGGIMIINVIGPN
jgi:hypothetical protein